jgi:hypothetical protein
MLQDMGDDKPYHPTLVPCTFALADVEPHAREMSVLP